MEATVFSFGANSYGQLGDGTQEDRLSPVELQLGDVGFSANQITAIEGGGGHTLFITDSGKCFACGSNTKGQLGIGDSEQSENVLHPSCVLIEEKVVQVAAGWDFSFFITDTKKLYCCGSNAFGQLGLEKVKESCHFPSEVCGSWEEDNMRGVACGLRHTVVWTESGSVYSCGAGRKGQLGTQAHTDKETLPRKINSFTEVPLPGDGKVKSVIAGAYHTAVLSEDGSVIVWGDNKHGQCGMMVLPATQIVRMPFRLPAEYFNSEKIVSLHCGWTHMVAVSDEGAVYTWGRNDYGQLGRESASEERFKPTPLALTNPQQINVGSEHNLVNHDGALYSWGWNEHGMCGTGDENNVLKPALLETLKHYNDTHRVDLIGCGAGHSFVVMKKDKEKR